MLTLTQLTQRLGQSIAAICPNGFTSEHENHCAHFVSHMFGYSFGANCRMMAGGSAPGANIRVQEVFARCPRVGKWADRPVAVTQCLVFNTQASNVKLASKVIANVPKKHIGIYCNGVVWHYSNARRQVVSVTLEDFSRHYPGSGFALFYGTLLA